MRTLLAVAVAGAVGSVSRYALGRAVQRMVTIPFPAGTLLVNVVGCVLVGAIAGHYLDDRTQPVLRTALIVGLCGGFTTYSAFSLETVEMLGRGEWGKAWGYVIATVLLCIAGTALGYQMSTRSL